VLAASLIFFSLICFFIFLGNIYLRYSQWQITRQGVAQRIIYFKFLWFCTAPRQKLFLLVVTIIYISKCEHWECLGQICEDLGYHVIRQLHWLRISALSLVPEGVESQLFGYKELLNGTNASYFSLIVYFSNKSIWQNSLPLTFQIFRTFWHV